MYSTSSTYYTTVPCSTPAYDNFTVQRGVPVPYIDGIVSSSAFQRCVVLFPQTIPCPDFDRSKFRSSSDATQILQFCT